MREGKKKVHFFFFFFFGDFARGAITRLEADEINPIVMETL